MSRSEPSAEALGALMQLTGGYAWSWLLFMAARLGLADHVAAGPQAIDVLAARCGAEASALRRLLDALDALGVVKRTEDGRYGPTPMSYWLRADVEGSQRPLALMAGDPRIWRAWAGALEAVKTGEVAFERVHDRSFFEVLDGAPELAVAFHAAGGVTPEWNEVMVEEIDLAGCKTLVDVGGGDGSLVRALLARQPELDAVVFERAATIALLREQAEGVPWRWQAGDFFEAVPAGADAYVLRRILHDWDDARARAILDNVRAAMPPSGRLFVLEYLVRPEARAASAMLDFTLFVLTGGRERSEAEYRALLEAAGFSVGYVRRTAAGIDVMLARPVARS